MHSERLAYEPVTPASLDAFHHLVEDDHVRRYLMDGQSFSRAWSDERIRDSMALVSRRGVGLWLARDQRSREVVGFCGFLEIPSIDPEPQLVYALYERFTGRGYATEMARAAIEEARRHDGFRTIVAAVDAVNVESVRVLDKLGFRRVRSVGGSFGATLVMHLED